MVFVVREVKSCFCPTIEIVVLLIEHMQVFHQIFPDVLTHGRKGWFGVVWNCLPVGMELMVVSDG